MDKFITFCFISNCTSWNPWFATTIVCPALRCRHLSACELYHSTLERLKFFKVNILFCQKHLQILNNGGWKEFLWMFSILENADWQLGAPIDCINPLPSWDTLKSGDFQLTEVFSDHYKIRKWEPHTGSKQTHVLSRVQTNTRDSGSKQ